MNDFSQFPITYSIIAITVLISIAGFTNADAKSKLMFYPYGMQSVGDYYRFVSHGFIHADYIHLLFNMFTFYSFGRVAEYALFDKPQYIIFYISALVASSVFDFIKNKSNPRYAALGASGAVSAVLFSTLIFNPWEKGVAILGVIALPNIVFGALYLYYCYYMNKKGNDNIGHSAHMWGSIYGFVFTGILHPDLLAGFFKQLVNPHF
jgi:membrane associated rhomboid family serine protease